MSSKALIRERNVLDKIKKYSFPPGFKNIGIAIIVLSFVALLVMKFTATGSEFAKLFAKQALLAGMLIASFSREPVEDEFFISLRMHSYGFAVLLAVVYTLVQPYIDYAIGSLVSSEKQQLAELSTTQVIFFMMAVQLGFYHLFKKLAS